MFVNSSELCRSPTCLNQTELPLARWKIIQVKKSQAPMKSQALTKNRIKKSLLIHHMYSKFFPSMFMPYIEGLKMDWTVNDGLYDRFLKWHLKCKNIFECELAMLVQRRKCKMVIAWSGDFGIDQYVSWNLTNEELILDVIWEKFEEFCKPQSNEVRARFDLLTSFRQGDLLLYE